MLAILGQRHGMAGAFAGSLEEPTLNRIVIDDED
jgi:hypothetical protein